METITKQRPVLERNMLTASLDYYKPTMSQLAYEKERDTEVTFTFKNRGEQRILDYVSVETLQNRFDDIAEQGFSPDEFSYLSSIMNTQNEKVFSSDYLNYLAHTPLPSVFVEKDPETNDIAISTTGDFPVVTFWETIVMSEVNEAYFERFMKDHEIDIFDIYDEGDRRLSEKIETLNVNPDIKFVDFGTRRRFSWKWQKHVLNRLRTECPDNLLGTSNVGFANTFNEIPKGTFAHEMPMIYAGLADNRGEDIRSSHNKFLRDWYELYGDDYTTALTDTFGSEFFFEDFTPEQALIWKGLRHDSGNPIEFGKRAIEFYEHLGIDPLDKTIVFSDGLDIDQIVRLHNAFKDKINTVFGWGTTLTNDLGIVPLNIVMKATEVDGTPTVKLSDNQGKHTGPADKIEEYNEIFTRTPANI